MNFSDATDIKLGSSTITALYYGSQQIWPTASVDYESQCLTFESLEDDNTITFNVLSSNTLDIMYSTDNENWSTATSSTDGTVLATLNTGEKLYITGDNSRYCDDETDYNFFTATGQLDVYGNIMSLISSTEFTNATIDAVYTFQYLFTDMPIVDASNLKLPATSLSTGCYRYMFNNCTVLSGAPELPARAVSVYAYAYMFNNCTSLSVPPELPATTLYSGCYEGMFNQCSVLEYAPELPATTLSYECYKKMFAYCSMLTEAPELSSTSLNIGCYQGMFRDCTGLTSMPTLPATTLKSNCYSGMFRNCISITSASLPATTLVTGCYQSMFSGCSSLNYINFRALDISASYCIQNMLLDVASTGTFVKRSTATWSESDIVPSGWTVQTA